MPASDASGASSRRIVRNAGIRAAGEVVGKLASLVFFVVMARELGQDGFGDFMFALSLSTVLMLVAGFGTEELVAREVARDRDRVHHYLPNVVALKAATSIGLLAIVVAIANVAGYSGDAKLAIYVVGLGVALENLGRTWHAVFTAYERLEMVSISLVAQRTLTAAVGVAILLSGGGLIAVSIIFAAGAFVGLLIVGQVLRRFVVAARWGLDRASWLPLVRAGVPIGIAGILLSVLMRADAALLGLLTGRDGNVEVGAYAAAFRVVEATLFISWAFSASALPWLSRQRDARAVARGYELGTKAITAVLMPIAVGCALFATEIVDLLYGQAYGDSVLPLQLLAVMTLLYGTTSLSVTLLISRDKPQVFGWIVGIVAVENVVMNLILIPRYGADATAFNAALSAVLLAVLGVAMVVRHVAPVRPLRIYTAPVVGGVAMAAVTLASALALVPAALLAVLTYAFATVAIERVAYPDDFYRLRAALPDISRLRDLGSEGRA